MSTIKIVLKEAFDVVEELVPKAARAVAEKSTKLGSKTRQIKQQIEAKDVELAGSQRRPDRAPDHDAPDPATPDADGPVQPLDTGIYRGLKDREVKGDGYEHDHIPSAGALIRARENALGRKLDPDEITELYDNAATIELPRSVHMQTRTWGGRNTQTQIGADAADLAAAAELDYADRVELLTEAGYSPDDVAAAIDRLRALNGERGIG